jgi:predicted nucleic acid-binding Zn ribbon protein
MKKQKQKINFCPKCGKALKAHDQFCSKCGNKLSNISLGAGIGRNWKWLTVSMVALAVVITAVVFAKTSNKSSAVRQIYNSPEVVSIAAAFNCSCGQCDKKLLDCDCPTANETHQYIAENLAKEKYSRRQIIEMVNNRYGHLINPKELQG